MIKHFQINKSQKDVFQKKQLVIESNQTLGSIFDFHIQTVYENLTHTSVHVSYFQTYKG